MRDPIFALDEARVGSRAGLSVSRIDAQLRYIPRKRHFKRPVEGFFHFYDSLAGSRRTLSELMLFYLNCGQ